jgi:hypothetical protein
MGYYEVRATHILHMVWLYKGIAFVTLPTGTPPIEHLYFVPDPFLNLISVLDCLRGE